MDLSGYLSKYSVKEKKKRHKKKAAKAQGIESEVNEFVRKGQWKSVETNEVVEPKELVEPKRETIYRDLSGRRISEKDESLKSTKRDREEEKRERKREIRETNVSEADRAKRVEELANEKSVRGKRLNRYEDDSEYNAQLRAEVKADDPAIMFDQNVRSAYREGQKGKGVSVTGRRLYRGRAPQNRFDIQPGWRWDGVDRTNGFETRWFRRQAEKEEERMERR